MAARGVDALGVLWVPLCFFHRNSAEFRCGCPGGALKGSMRIDRHPLGEKRQSCGWVTVASANRLQCRLSTAAAQAPASNSVDTTSREQPAAGPGPGRWWYLSRALFYQHVREHAGGSFAARAGLYDPHQATPSQEGPRSVTSLPPLSPKSTLLAQLCALGDSETCPFAGWCHPGQALQGRWGKGLPLGSSMPSPDPSGSAVCAR